MSNDVVLGSALRTNLLSLQRTQSGIDKIQNILATGLKVSSALDNPQNFFAAQGLSNRASDLTRQLDGIGQSISTIQAADKGASAVGQLVDQAESLANSAVEELSSNGASIAKVSGNVDLRGITDITSLTGVANNDVIQFSYVDKDGTTVVNDATSRVTIETGDSIDEIIGKINDLGAAAASSTDYGQGEVFTASLNDDGGLEVTNKTGGSFRVIFEAAGAPNDTLAPADAALGTALGFGGIAQNTAAGGATATSSNYEVTALASTTLVSGAFYDTTANNGFAEASELLNGVRETEGGTARNTFRATSEIEISVNGEKIIDTGDATGPGGTLDLTATSIQGLVDRINASDELSAAYDETTGEFSISAKSADVQTIQFDVVEPNAGASPADFDFGIKADLDNSAVANSSNGNNFVLGAANETLAQIQSDYNEVRSQIDSLVGDAGYRGVNLLKGDTLTTFFDEDRDSSLNTVGRDLSSAGLGISEADFSRSASIQSSLSEILDAKNDVRSFGTAIANSLSIVQTREDFTKDLVSELEAGADKLTVADQNEEGAKLLALQTRQQLGVTSLSLAVQSQQSVLRLF